MADDAAPGSLPIEATDPSGATIYGDQTAGKIGPGPQTAPERVVDWGMQAAGAPSIGEAAGAGRAVLGGDWGTAATLGGSAALGLLPMALGIKPEAEAAEAAAQGIRAYHGSPYDFDRFDISRIGTGQRAQSYGHGLYFAENENVARGYRDDLASSNDYSTSAGGSIPDWVGTSIKQIADQFGMDSDRYRYVIDRHIDDFQGRIAEEQRQARVSGQPWLAKDRIANQQQIVDSLQAIKSGATLLPRGRMYEVNLRADPATFLDWDKPFSQQPPQVQQRLADAYRARGMPLDESGQPLHFKRDPTGEIMHASLSGAAGQHVAAEHLREAGINGIRYLDQGSRAAGTGTSNYVVFNDKVIDILKKYGMLPFLFSGGAAAVGSGDNQ